MNTVYMGYLGGGAALGLATAGVACVLFPPATPLVGTLICCAGTGTGLVAGHAVHQAEVVAHKVEVVVDKAGAAGKAAVVFAGNVVGEVGGGVKDASQALWKGIKITGNELNHRLNRLELLGTFAGFSGLTICAVGLVLDQSRAYCSESQDLYCSAVKCVGAAGITIVFITASSVGYHLHKKTITVIKLDSEIAANNKKGELEREKVKSEYAPKLEKQKQELEMQRLAIESKKLDLQGEGLDLQSKGLKIKSKKLDAEDQELELQSLEMGAKKKVLLNKIQTIGTTDNFHFLKANKNTLEELTATTVAAPVWTAVLSGGAIVAVPAAAPIVVPIIVAFMGISYLVVTVLNFRKLKFSGSSSK